LPLAGVLRGVDAWMRSAMPLALGQLLFVAIAFGCLAYAPFCTTTSRCA
jgi:cytochrome c-type biogenesis protein CcmF